MAKRRVRPPLAAEVRRLGPMLPAVVLVGVVLVAVVAAGWLGSSPSETTTTAVPSLADAAPEPLRWERGTLETEAWPLGVVELDGRYLLYGATGDETPPSVWASDDGLTWESLGSVLGPDHAFWSVRSTAQGLLAVGTTGSGPWEQPAVWQSSDGVEWRPVALPDEVRSGEYEVTAATATEDRVVVFGSERYDWLETRVSRALVERGLVAPDAFESMWLFVEGGEPCIATLEGGPLIGASVSFDTEELGLSDEETERCRSETNGWFTSQATYAWTTENEADWRRIEVSSSWIEEVFVDDEGTIVALTYEGSTSVVLRSADGYDWSHKALPFGHNNVRLWKPVGMLAVRDVYPTPKITHSRHGETWDAFAIPALVLSRDYDWRLDGPEVGGAGALVVALGEGEERVVVQGAEPGPLERDGYRLVLSRGWGYVSWILERDGVTVLESRTDPPSGISVDPVKLEVIFSDPATGETLTHFTFDEIERAIAATEPTFLPQTAAQILFSPDGVAWSVQDAAELTAEGAFVEMAHVADDRVLLFTVEANEDRPPLTRVWVALAGEGEGS